MTIVDLLERSHRLIAANETAFVEPETLEVAVVIVDLLGPGSTCGVEPYEVRDGELVIGDTNCLEVGGRISPDEARARARMLLEGADAAEVGR